MRRWSDEYPHHDPEDPEILDLNAQYDEDTAPDDFNHPRRTPLGKTLALFLAIAFLGYVLQGLLTAVQFPALDFWADSARLREQAWVQERQRAVVDIRVLDSLTSSRERSGTGFNIAADGQVVTNQHVVSGAVLLIVTFPDGRTFFVEEWEEHPATDLALVRLKTDGLPTVCPRLDRLPDIGESVVVIGNPLGFPRVAVQGVVAAYGHVDDRLGYVMEIETSVYKGSSGSPVFDKDGMVVAVVFAAGQSDDGGGRGFAIPLVRLQAILNGQLKE